MLAGPVRSGAVRLTWASSPITMNSVCGQFAKASAISYRQFCLNISCTDGLILSLNSYKPRTR